MNTYLPRLVDEELDELQTALAAITLEGPKGVGKTETAQRRAATVYRLDNPAQRAIAEADATQVLIGDAPVLVDEWQRVPAVWDNEAMPTSNTRHYKGSSNNTGSP